MIGTIVAQRSRTEGTGGARIDDMNMGGGPPNVAHVSMYNHRETVMIDVICVYS